MELFCVLCGFAAIAIGWWFWYYSPLTRHITGRENALRGYVRERDRYLAGARGNDDLAALVRAGGSHRFHELMDSGVSEAEAKRASDAEAAEFLRILRDDALKEALRARWGLSVPPRDPEQITGAVHLAREMTSGK